MEIQIRLAHLRELYLERNKLVRIRPRLVLRLHIHPGQFAQTAHKQEQLLRFFQQVAQEEVQKHFCKLARLRFVLSLMGLVLQIALQVLTLIAAEMQASFGYRPPLDMDAILQILAPVVARGRRVAR